MRVAGRMTGLARKPESRAGLNAGGTVFKLLPILLLTLLPAGHAFCETKAFLSAPAPRVLVIHSYYPTFTWTNNITMGICGEFDKKGRHEALNFEFLDAKRHPEKEYLNYRAELLRMQYPDTEKPDVIICSDDQALKFLLDRSEALFQNVPIVFCGVNGYFPSMREARPALTGIIEAIDPGSTLKIALRLQPDIREVLVINDITLTGRAIEKMARQAFEPFKERLRFRYVGDMSMDELQAEVSSLSGDAIVFLFVFNRDNKGRDFTHETSLRLINDHCRVPIYGPWTFYLGQGIVGGMLTSGEAQGRAAARIALRILDGEKAEDIAVVMKSPNRYMFDHRQLVLHGLAPGKLPAGSTIINRPESLYQKYRYRIWAILFALLSQLAVIIFLLMNIGRRRHAEKALSASEQKYRTLVETIADGVFAMDKQGRFTLLNPVFEKITGYSVQDFLGRHFSEILPPELIGIMTENFERSLAEKTIFTNEVNIKKKGGKTVPIEVNVTTMIGSDGTPTGRIGVARDITERKKAEETLRESEKKFHSFFDLAPLAIGLSRVETGEIIDVNSMFCKLTQSSRKELIGRKTTELGFYTEADRAELLTVLQTSGRVEGFKKEFRIKDGSTKIGLMYAKIIQAAGQNFILTMILDITGQQQLEEQLRVAKKMEVIGTLAGGVAHDLNNVLSGLVGAPDLILSDLPEDSPLREPVLIMKEAGERAAAIVSDLLTLARRGVVTAEVVNLNEIIRVYIKSPEFKKLSELYPGVTIKSDLQENLPNIMGSSFHLLEIVMNLVLNAAEAMPGGGDLLVSTRNEYIDQGAGISENIKKGDYVVLTVSDSGVGILSADKGKIFEPFYTKKVMGRSGTGLGLAVVWGAVKDHKGYINVQSEKGKGSAFTIYFPVTGKKPAEKEKALPLENYRGKGESVLVVDDSGEQRRLISEMLEKLGYSVETAASGEEAVRYLKNNSADLLILDMIMDPGIDGLETYKRVLEFHPGQKAVILSGFSETERVKEAQKLGAGQYIKKPYTIKDIGFAVKQELARPRK